MHQMILRVTSYWFLVILDIRTRDEHWTGSGL